MDTKVNLMGVLLWSLVLTVVWFSYTGIKYMDNEKLKNSCDKYKYVPQNMPDSQLSQVLKDLNELRSSQGDTSLQWVDSCTGLIMVEMKSRSFEKNFQGSQK